MGWNQSIFTLLIVTSGQQAQGFFVYNGTPALGNPPVAMIVAPGVTQDPFGNPAASIMQVGNLAGAHFGIGNDGSIFLVNTAGKVIFLGRTTDGAFFWYNSSGEGPHNLLGSFAPSNTTDPAGNPVNAGFQVHGTGSAANAAANVEINVQGTVPIVFFSTGVAEESTSGNIQADVENPGASEALSLFVTGPDITTAPGNVYAQLSGPAKDGSALPFGGLLYNDGVNPLKEMFRWGSPGVQVGTLFSSDSNAYDVGEARLTRTTDLVVNTLAPGQQVFNGVAIGVGTYELEGFLHLNLAAAGTPHFQFGGLTAVGVMLIEFIEINEGAPGGFGNVGSQGAFASAFGGAAMAGGGRVVFFRGLISLSTAGTLGLFAYTSAIADPFTIVWEGSYMNLRPVY